VQDGAQRGTRTDPLVLNLNGLLLSRVGHTPDDVEELALPAASATDEYTNSAINDRTDRRSRRFTGALRCLVDGSDLN